jgi:fatty-acyl-CoA synthase
VHPPSTLVDALASLPRGQERGFRFRSIEGEERYHPFEELEREAHRRAALLAGIGLAKGDRVALVIADPREFVLTFLGSQVAGIVAVPIYPRAGFKAKNAYVDTVSHIVRASGARVLITLDATKDVIAEVLARGTPLEKVVVLEELLRERPGAAPAPDIGPEDLSFLQFTSGSTSMPKGVMVTHRNLVANAVAFLGPHGLDRRREDLAVTWLPLYHDMGLIGFVLGTLICDIPVTLVPTEAFARRPSMWMENMSRFRATITFAPNFAFGLATKRTRDKDLEGLDLSQVRIAGCGAEPINPQVMRGFVERFGPVGFDERALLPCYGMAESTLAISFSDHAAPIVVDRVDAAALKAGRAEPAREGAPVVEIMSCGHSFPGHEVKITDESGAPVREREIGEIVVRGPSVTRGYFDNPGATAEAFRDDWLRTGDLGYLANGQLHICGRLKDLIIIRGANYHPQDIEWAVSEVPGVRRDNVVAFSVTRDGEERLVIAAEGNSTDATDLRRAIAAKVNEVCALHVQEVAVVRVGSLPKTSSGKAQRRRTKQLFEDGQLEVHPVA